MGIIISITKMNKPKIQIIIGSTRQNRSGELVAKYVKNIASNKTDLEFELIDLRDWKLPFYDEVAGPMGLKGNYSSAIMIPFIWSAFGPDGAMIDGKYVSQIDTLLTDLSWWTHALKNARTNS